MLFTAQLHEETWVCRKDDTEACEKIDLYHQLIIGDRSRSRFLLNDDEILEDTVFISEDKKIAGSKIESDLAELMTQEHPDGTPRITFEYTEFKFQTGIKKHGSHKNIVFDGQIIPDVVEELYEEPPFDQTNAKRRYGEDLAATLLPGTSVLNRRAPLLLTKRHENKFRFRVVVGRFNIVRPGFYGQPRTFDDLVVPTDEEIIVPEPFTYSTDELKQQTGKEADYKILLLWNFGKDYILISYSIQVIP